MLDAPLWRLPLTVLAIYAVEWSFGAAYAALGLWPWHYEHGWASDFSGGHITLLYLPGWVLFAWGLLPVWRAVRALSPRGARAFGSAFARARGDDDASREAGASHTRPAPVSPDRVPPKAGAGPSR